MRYLWDEAKRQVNLEKHGLDFADADLVLMSGYRLDIRSGRNGEWRVQSFAYVLKAFAVMTIVYVSNAEGFRIISFRRANRSEREIYHDWLENHSNDA